MRYGAGTGCPGGMLYLSVFDFEESLDLVTLTGPDSPRLPHSVVIASDGAWEPLLSPALWVPETLPWSLTCRDGGRC